MAQIEEMKRLINDGKIVGYQLHARINDFGTIMAVYQSPNIEFDDSKKIIDLYDYNIDTEEPIGHDSYELGIKYDGDWIFEGDILELRGVVYELIYRKFDGSFLLQYDRGILAFSYGDIERKAFKCIGNIHEEVKQ